jgi:tRNA pseudouridine55 synthase
LGVEKFSGALLVDKPAGPTSHDVVAVVRRALATQRIGHTGTLDPLATGLLVLLVGPATRLAQFVAADEKEYFADVRFGTATPTYDATSLPAEGGTRDAGSGPGADPAIAEIEAALGAFRGTFMQTPPPFSAKKIAGVAAHERARKQQHIDLAPVEVTVRELELLEAAASRLAPRASLVRLRIVASAGFYVRSLAHELGQRLGCGAHLEALRRIRAGQLSIADAMPLDAIVNDPEATARRIVAPGDLLRELPAATVNGRGLVRALHGNPLGPDHLTARPKEVASGDLVRLFDGPELVAVGRTAWDGALHPIVVLVGAPEVKY